jgi:hypothetical protein
MPEVMEEQIKILRGVFSKEDIIDLLENNVAAFSDTNSLGSKVCYDIVVCGKGGQRLIGHIDSLHITKTINS